MANTSDSTWLPFDFAVLEGLARRECPRFPAPKTDNEAMLELQGRFIEDGDRKAVSELLKKSEEYCLKLVHKEATKNRKIARLSREEKREKAFDAAASLIAQMTSDRTFVVRKNYTGCLYFKVMRELYYHKKSDEIVDYVDITEFLRKKDVTI